jgi:hypothetical protein
MLVLTLPSPALRVPPRAQERAAGTPERMQPGEREFEARGDDTGSASGQRAQPMRLLFGTPVSFVAQFLAQQNPQRGAHIEDWRGARGAYARADGLASSPAQTASAQAGGRVSFLL